MTIREFNDLDNIISNLQVSLEEKISELAAAETSSQKMEIRAEINTLRPVIALLVRYAKGAQ